MREKSEGGFYAVRISKNLFLKSGQHLARWLLISEMAMYIFVFQKYLSTYYCFERI
jgi:hypothetical protein